MNWNISAWSIRTPIPAIMLFLILIVLGLVAFNTLGVDENPNIDLPIVTVTVIQPGAAPSELETQVTRKVEDAVAGIGNIKHLTSVVTDSNSTTVIEFELGTSADRSTNDVRDAVSRIRQLLPQTINDPIIQRVDFAGGPFVTYSVTSKDMNVAELSWFIDNTVNRALLGVTGVGQIQRSGGVDREIHVDLDPTRLESLGVTADMVNVQVAGLNINLPGGEGRIGSVAESIRTLGSSETVEKLRAARISLPSGSWARLDAMGTVTDTTAEPTQRALLNGKPVVSFSVVRSTGSNLVDVGAGVEERLAALRKQNPNVQITMIRTNAKYVMESYHASLDSLVIGAVLAVIVIWLFLKDWWAAIISALAMPMSVIPTFAVMKAANFTLNNMSLLGLSLVVGILVDDAIVEIENIVRHIHMGKSPYDAAIEAADEIGLAVMATTMAIIVVFVPVAFMGGIPGQFFRQFGLTVAVAVFFSLLVARSITPTMAAYWMKAPKKHGEDKSLLMRGYDLLLEWAMGHRFLTVSLAVVFFVFGMTLFASIPTSVVPSVDRGETVVNVQMAPGTELARTTEVALQLTKILQARPEVTGVYAAIGSPSIGPSGPGGGGGSSSTNQASLYVTLTPREKRKLSQQQVEDAVRPALKTVPGARLTFQGTGFGGTASVLLASDNAEELQRSAEGLIRDMRTLPELADVTSDAALLRPEIQVIPDLARASEQGVSVISIAHTADIATLGDLDQNLAKFDLPDRQINIRVEIDPRYRNDLNTIRNMKVAATAGRLIPALIPLSEVSTVVMGNGPAQINRYARQRQISISGSLRPGATLGETINRIHGMTAYKNLPPDVKDVPAGDAEIQRDIFTGFAESIGAAILFIYAVLVLLFGGFLQPFTIMMALPLSIGGAVIGLMLAHQSLGLYALIGIVMLMGLATKNSILLVEYCLMSMHKGMSRDEAIRSAGDARMRPILMTTVAMIAGMIPIALGIGSGSEVRIAMAIAVIGGLITSTFLTLLVVPVVFSYVDDFRLFVLRLRGIRPVSLTHGSQV